MQEKNKLKPLEYYILNIYDFEYITPKNILLNVNVTYKTIQTTLSSLEKKGLIARTDKYKLIFKKCDQIRPHL